MSSCSRRPGIKGVSRTRLAFVSDRGGTRRELGGMIRRFKEVWTADYDGANQQRVTSDGDLDMTPSWAPDARAIAYTSFRRGFQDIFITSLGDRRVESPTRAAGKNWLPAWSPDGARTRLHVGPRRQRGNLRHEPRRIGRSPPDAPPGHRHLAHLVARRRPHRVHLEPDGLAADLGHERRRVEPAGS